MLGHVEDVYSFFTSNVVHKTLFPFPIVPSLHAARWVSRRALSTRTWPLITPIDRISIAFQHNARKAQSYRALSWGQYLIGFLIMVGLHVSNMVPSMTTWCFAVVECYHPNAPAALYPTAVHIQSPPLDQLPLRSPRSHGDLRAIPIRELPLVPHRTRIRR